MKAHRNTSNLYLFEKTYSFDSLSFCMAISLVFSIHLRVQTFHKKKQGVWTHCKTSWRDQQQQLKIPGDSGWISRREEVLFSRERERSGEDFALDRNSPSMKRTTQETLSFASFFFLSSRKGEKEGSSEKQRRYLEHRSVYFSRYNWREGTKRLVDPSQSVHLERYTHTIDDIFFSSIHRGSSTTETTRKRQKVHNTSFFFLSSLLSSCPWSFSFTT